MNCPKCHAENPDTSLFCSNCTSPLSHKEKPPESYTKTILMTDKSLNAGNLFAKRYQVIEELGKGGMGQV
jgi:predicted amidophosphoribosyltransferase